jgi:pilus assembly protein CpaE
MTAVTSERTMLGVVLTGSHAELSGLIADLEAPESGIQVLARVANLSDGSVRLSALEPRVVLHCASWSNEGAADAMATLADDVTAIRRQTAAPIILLVSGSETDVVEAALGAGVDDVLLLPQRVETIAFAVRKAAQAGRTTGRTTGNVITVFSPKGGTGKTVLSTNVAAYLASKTRKRVLLIDLDLQFGDAAIMLGLDPSRTMFDLVQAGGDLDPGKLVAYTTRHRSGLDVLVAPMLPEHAELVTEQKVVQLVEVAREAYDIVVIDTSPFFYGPMLALLRETDQLLMLCGLDVPTLKNVRLSLRTLELLGFPRSRTSLVLNRVTAEVGLTAKDVEDALGVRVAFEVPNDAVVAPSVNQGAVPALKAADSDFACAIANVAATLEPSLEVPAAETPDAPAHGATRLRRLVARRHLVEGRT